MTSVYENIDKSVLPDEYLPDDYTGPSAGPLQKCIGKLSFLIGFDMILTSSGEKRLVFITKFELFYAKNILGSIHCINC